MIAVSRKLKKRKESERTKESLFALFFPGSSGFCVWRRSTGQNPDRRNAAGGLRGFQPNRSVNNAFFGIPGTSQASAPVAHIPQEECAWYPCASSSLGMGRRIVSGYHLPVFGKKQRDCRLQGHYTHTKCRGCLILCCYSSFGEGVFSCFRAPMQYCFTS